MNIAVDTVFVWQADVDRLNPTPAGVSADERQRAARFQRACDRDRYLAVRGLLRRLLGCYLGCDPLGVSIGYGPKGKPELESGELSFNVSHSNKVALIAIGRGRAIGVDVEEVRERAALHDVMGQLPASDRRMLEQLPAAERTRAFLACWTRHEALLKARGEALVLPLEDMARYTPEYSSVPLEVDGSHVATLVAEHLPGDAPLKIIRHRVH